MTQIILRITLITVLMLIALVTAVRLPANAQLADILAYTAPHERDGNYDVMLFDVWHRLATPVARDAGHDWAHDWSQDGGLLVVESDRDESRSLFAFPFPPAAPYSLFGGRSDHVNPVWSPDGSQIAFVQTTDTIARRLTLMLRDTATGSERVLFARYDRFNPPQWTPDGLGVVVPWDSGSGGELLYINAADGRQEQYVSALDAVIEVAWSPDGERLAVISYDDGYGDLYLVDAAGGTTRITDDQMLDYSPIWSPDGARVAFVSRRDGGDDVYVADVQTGEIRKISHGEGFYIAPHWTDNGQHLVVLSNRDDLSTSIGGDFYLLDANSTAIQRLTINSRASTELLYAWRP